MSDGIVERIRQLERMEDAVIGGCRLEEMLGRGAMGVVYRGLHVGLNRPVAVKLIPVVREDDSAVKRFLAEARAAAKLEHQNITQVYDVGFQKGYCYIVMQLLVGKSLADVLKQQRVVPPLKALQIARSIAAGLSAAHAKGIVHRDLKPDNIMITDTGVIKITDFGLAQDRENDDMSRSVAGTPFYMAPEQWKGAKVDGRADLYALGVILYSLVTGRRPFNGLQVEDLMKQHLKEIPPPPAEINTAVSEGVSSIIRKLMAKDPAKRYRDSAALVKDIDRVRAGLEPMAMTDFKKLIPCSFCDTLNNPATRRCSVCNEPLEQVVGELDIAVRKDEFYCPACGEFVRVGERNCPRCGVKFCVKCGREIAEKGEHCLGCAVWSDDK